MEEKREIRQANAITQSRYDFSKIQKNAFYKIIEKVSKSPQADLFGNLIVEIYPKDLAEITDREHTRKAWLALRELRHKDIDIEKEDGTLLNVGFINYAEFNPKWKCFEVEVSKKIMPYLIELTEKFTVYNIVVAMSLKSKHSQRFYEFGCQYRNKTPSKFFLDIEDLRNKFCLGKGYKLKTDIKKRVIDPAILELKEAYENNSCDLWLDYWEEGRGEKTRFWFNIHTKEQKENILNIKQIENQLIAIGRMTDAIFKKDKKFCKRIIEALRFNPEDIPLVYEKLVKNIDKSVKKKENPGALCRYILQHDFNIV